VHETKRINELLKELQLSGKHMAVVVDEYCGTIGIVTIEDMLEEVVGEIEDEYDARENPYKKISNTSFFVETRMEVSALNELIGLEIPKGDYETVGGFLLERFQKIPKNGDTLETDELIFTVIDSEERGIKRVQIDLKTDRDKEKDNKEDSRDTDRAKTKSD